MYILFQKNQRFSSAKDVGVLLAWTALLFLLPYLQVYADQVTYTVSDGSMAASTVSGACDTSLTNATPSDGAQGTVMGTTCVGRSDTPVIKWTKALTWQTMGVPAGSTITQVDGSFKYRVVQESHAATQAIGVMQLRNSDDSAACAASDLEASFDPGAVNASFTTRNSSAAINVNAGCDTAATTVTMLLQASPATGNNAAATSELRADDVSLVITYTPPASTTLSGTLYGSDGATQITTGKTIRAAIGTSTVSLHSTTTNAGSGAWTLVIPPVTSISSSTPIVIWVDGDTTTRAAVFTKASSTNSVLSGLDLYQNHVIIRHEGTSGTTTRLADMTFYDSDDDSDIQYNASASGLTVNTNSKLYIWPGKTFTASGTVTVNGNASSTSQTDGSLHIGTGASYTSTGTTTLAGSFIASSTGTYSSTSTLLFNATTTGKTILATTTSIGSTTFNGSGGGWSFNGAATTTNLTITTGTLTAPSTHLTITGNYSNSGTFTHNSGTTTFAGTSAQTLGGAMTGTSAFSHINFSGGGTKGFSNSASSSNFMIQSGSGEVTAPSGHLSVAGNYTNAGTFTHNSGTTTFNGTSAQTIAGTLTNTSAFNHVVMSGAGTKAFSSNASTSNFIIQSGSGAVTAPSGYLTITGNYSNSGTFTHNSGTTTFNGSGAQTIAGTMTGTSLFNHIVFQGAGTKAFSSNASTSNFIIQSGSGAVTAPSGTLTITGNYGNAGTFTHNSGTTTFSGTDAQTATGTMTGTSAFATIIIQNTSATTTFGAAVSATQRFYASSSDGILIAFAPHATATLANATMVGALGNEIVLRSAVYDSQWLLDLDGSYTLSYIDVKDSNACLTSGNNIVKSNIIDSGNNDCWDYAASISSASNQVFSVGQTATAIAAITLTEDISTTITAANDIRIAIATSTVRMQFDTEDVTATFGGTASGKVSNPVSYSADGSLLIIPVNSDFTAGDTLTISDLSFSEFTHTNNAVSALSLRIDGTGAVAVSTDDKTVAIKGGLVLAEHSDGQVMDMFESTTNSNITLFAFNLAAQGEGADIAPIVFDLVGINRILSEDITNIELYRDMDGDASYSGPDVAVGGGGSPSISGRSGTITFSTSFLATSTSLDYILIADVAHTFPGYALKVRLSTEDITASGTTTALSITAGGSVEMALHRRGGQSQGGGGGEVDGDDIPEGEDRGGGEQGGGGGEIGGDTGESLGSEPDFNAPSAHGTPHGAWTNGANAYASDGSYVTTTGDSAQHSYGNFGFSVPSNNTVTGITVKFEGKGSTAAGTISVRLSWDGGGSVTSLLTSDTLTASDVVYTLGSGSNLWGRTWTPSEFSNGSFTIELVANPSSNTVQVDAIHVRVHHQASGGGGGGGGGGEI